MPQILKPGIKDKILESALDSFLENGYRNTSMKAIAHKAGIATGNIYRYFKNKEAVFTTLVTPVAEEIKALFGMFIGELPTLNPQGRMDIAEWKLDEFIAIYRNNRRVFVLLFEKSDATQYEAIRDDVIQNICVSVNRLKRAVTDQPLTSQQEVLVQAYVTAYIQGLISILVAKIDEDEKLDTLQKFLPFMRGKLVESL